MGDSQRVHALDNLRAVMMWLGIVLHAAVNHLAGESPLEWRDRETSLAADLIAAFIHAFRMPVFFILAGFFVALLVGRRGYGGMLKHRLRRIGLPFIVFWPPVFAGMAILVMLYVHLMFDGTLGLDPAIMPVDPERPAVNTAHMWFIYYLLWFCIATALVGRLGERLPDSFRADLSAFVMRLAAGARGFIVLALPLAAAGMSNKLGVIEASGSFILQLDEIMYNGLFFLIGWHLYQHRHAALALYVHNCWRYAGAGAVFFILFLGFSDAVRHDAATTLPVRLALGWLYGCASVFWSFALIGLFVRYLSQQNRFLRYLSESSYWVYLVHMLFTIGFGVMLYHAPLHALAKIGINIVATTVLCLASYQLLVRYTPVGTLLNGRRHVFGRKQEFGGPAPVA